MKEKIRNFMQGRYGLTGLDALNRTLMVLTLVFILCELVFKLKIFSVLSYITLILYFARMLSRNIGKRSQENARFLRLVGKLSSRLRFARRRWNDRRTYRYFACPKCKANMRVPKGRGNIRITCRCCGEEFDRKS